MTERLRDSIYGLFPKMPEKDVEEVLEISCGDGAVGSAQWLYFSPHEDAREAYDHAAALAVRAYVRHRNTDYDEKLSLSTGDEEARADARRAVAPMIEEKLEECRAS